MLSVHIKPSKFEIDTLHRMQKTCLFDVSVFKKSRFRPFSPSTQHDLAGIFKFTTLESVFEKSRFRCLTGKKRYVFKFTRVSVNIILITNYHQSCLLRRRGRLQTSFEFTQGIAFPKVQERPIETCRYKAPHRIYFSPCPLA